MKLWPLVTTAFLLGSRLAWAEGGIVTIPPGDDKIVPLSEGAKAPFPGQLFSTDTALRWGFWLQQYQFRLKEDVATEKAICAADSKLWATKLGLEQEKYTTVTVDYQKRLADAQKANEALRKELDSPPWYKSGAFIFASGATVMAGVVALSIWAISSAP